MTLTSEMNFKSGDFDLVNMGEAKQAKEAFFRHM